jgi:uncharacterized protein YqeY
VLIEAYMPKAASEDHVRKLVMGALEHMAKDAGGKRPGPKDMGPTMRVVQQWIMADGVRADGKMVSELVKEELAKGA